MNPKELREDFKKLHDDKDFDSSAFTMSEYIQYLERTVSILDSENKRLQAELKVAPFKNARYVAFTAGYIEELHKSKTFKNKPQKLFRIDREGIATIGSSLRKAQHIHIDWLKVVK